MKTKHSAISRCLASGTPTLGGTRRGVSQNERRVSDLAFFCPCAPVFAYTRSPPRDGDFHEHNFSTIVPYAS